MKEIAEEWKQREMEREVVMKRKIHEYNALENNLKKVKMNLDYPFNYQSVHSHHMSNDH